MCRTMSLKILLFSIALLIPQSNGTINILTDVIQRQVFGVPEIHAEQNWPFDPDAGLRRVAKYESENGKFGEKQIERLGLGTDGNQEQRLIEQQRRDEGHLGGLNFFRP